MTIRTIRKTCKALIALTLLPGISTPSLPAPYDSGPQSLGTTVGATDNWKITCAGTDTDHLSFKIMDQTPVVAGSTQLVNVHLAKDGVTETADASGVSSGQVKNAELAGGNGRYDLLMDTIGTNTAITRRQWIKLNFQCQDANGNATRVSAKATSRRIKNDNTSKARVRCLKKRGVDSAKLIVTVTNKTPPTIPSQILAAQVIKGQAALNVTDASGDEVYSEALQLKGGSGDYVVMVDNTGTDPSKDNSRIYTFQASCQNSAGADAATDPSGLLIQDQ